MSEPWDLIVIGGGITGAGLFLEAAKRGLQVVLFEASDFSSGTSSRSTKLVHGGLRYLRNGHLRLTYESVRERERLLREGAGLVEPLGFYLASFDRVSPWLYGMGLAAYDLFGGRWAHTRHTREEVFRRVPPLSGAPLRMAHHYYDASTDDCRLVFRALQDGTRLGGIALNYARVTGLVRTRDGRVRGVRVRDEAPDGGSDHEVIGKAVVNATGVWADSFRSELGKPTRLRTIRGSHLVFPHDRFPLREAVTLTHPRDGRVLFAVPWEGVTLLGTTDQDHPHALKAPFMSEGEAHYLEEALAFAFPSLALSRTDALSSYAGVRAVVGTGAKDPSKESRDHLLLSESDLVTIMGGKLTTFRLMALDVLSLLAPRLGIVEPDRNEGPLFLPLEIAPPLPGVAERDKTRLLGRYGATASMLASHPDRRTVPGTQIRYGELFHAMREESVVHLDDLLLRRTRLGLLLPRGGDALLLELAPSAQALLGWDETRWESEVQRYRRIVRQEHNPEGGTYVSRSGDSA